MLNFKYIEKLKSKITELFKTKIIFEKPDPASIAIFAREFSILFKSGVTLVRSLKVLSKQIDNKVLKNCIEKVYKDIVFSGCRLSKALSKHSRIFPPILINLVFAGENSSSMAETLERIAIYLEKELHIKRSVKAAMIYPVVALTVCVLVIIAMFRFVLPSFIPFFESLGSKTPLPTKILMETTKIISHPFALIFVILILGLTAYFIKSYLSSPVGKYWFDSWVLRIPILGPILTKISALNFCRTLSTLYASGVPFFHSIDILEKTTENEFIKKIIHEAKESMKSGMSLSEYLINNSVFPPIVNQMVAVGEESGQLNKMLNKVVEFYDSEIDYTMNSLTSLIEPLMIIALGILAAFVILSILLPLYEVLVHLGG